MNKSLQKVISDPEAAAQAMSKQGQDLFGGPQSVAIPNIRITSEGDSYLGVDSTHVATGFVQGETVALKQHSSVLKLAEGNRLYDLGFSFDENIRPKLRHEVEALLQNVLSIPLISNFHF